MRTWLLLLYKVPSEPSARRVYVWRKLKRLGAILLTDAAWVLPANDRTREHFQWLAAEIVELEGEALVWESHLLLAGQDEKLVQQFTQPVEAAYREIMSDLEKADADLAALSRRYQLVKAQDYFQSATGNQVRQMLMSATGDSKS